MIKIHPSPTADTRTCDFTQVDPDTLRASSLQHIQDVRAGLEFLAAKLLEAGVRHDFDKLQNLEGFHADFKTGFKESEWWDSHKTLNRHHLTSPEGIPQDVNLVDVLEFVVDCTMAGMARKGSVYPLKLPAEVLARALQNTVALVLGQIVVEK